MRPGIALTAALLVALTAAPVRAENIDGAAALLAKWLEVQEDEPAAWGQAWLQVEATQSRYLDQSFYVRLSPTEKGALIEQALDQDMADFPARMKDLSTLQGQWASDLAAVRATMAKELGAAPSVDVHLWYAMSPQKAVAATIDGRASIAINARLLLPYQPEVTRLLLTRALLVHAQSAWTQARQEASLAPSVAGHLQVEGISAWAATRVVPGSPVASVLGVTADQAQLLEKARSAIAREMLTSLESGQPAQLDRFFGPKAPEGWPPATGRYMGLLVAREVASELGGPAIVRMSRKSYTERARAILKRLSTSAS